MGILEVIRAHASAMPNLPKFALVMALIVGIPPLFRRIRLPPLVGLLVIGIVLGPTCLGIFGENRPIGNLFADLGALMMMFFSGLEIDLDLFRRARARSVTYGIITTVLPFALGSAVGLWAGYEPLTAAVIGSLLSSHTLLASPIVRQLGANRNEPMTVTVGATVFSDTLSLMVFAICVGTFKYGFSISGLGLQLIEIGAFVPLIVSGLSRVGAYALSKVSDDEDASFILMLGIMAAAGVLAQVIDLPGIVGAFLAGLAVNGAAVDRPAKEKLEFFGKSFFIPSFFIVTGSRIDPHLFINSIAGNFSLVAGLVGAVMIGKWIAAATVSRANGYTRAARLTMWSLTLPQVAATLTAAMAGFDTIVAGRRLLDARIFNAVVALAIITSVLGLVLTDRFAPLMLKSAPGAATPAVKLQTSGS
ncbi:MAG TPA: cation:proton antiporter [Candidatus Binataceae bacterium]